MCELLKPLSTNDFTLKDSFDAGERIRNISPTDMENGYHFVSFDVVSLFTNLPLKRTLNLILDRVYRDKLIQTITMKNRTRRNYFLIPARKQLFRSTVNCMSKLMVLAWVDLCLLYTSPSPRDRTRSRMPSSA